MRQWIKHTLLSACVLGTLPAFAAQVVDVSLWNKGGKMGVDVSAAPVHAGEVTFHVHNASTAMEHEMLVIRLNAQQIAHPDQLPYEQAAARFNEEAVKDLGEVAELEPGASGSLSVMLKPGTYELVCNVAGHYKAGLFTTITVK